MVSLKRDQSINILPAGKGGATVVLDRVDYIQKAEQQLSDETTYKPLQRDPTAKQVMSISKRSIVLSGKGLPPNRWPVKSTQRWLPSPYDCLLDRLAPPQPREMATMFP